MIKFLYFDKSKTSSSKIPKFPDILTLKIYSLSFGSFYAFKDKK